MKNSKITTSALFVLFLATSCGPKKQTVNTQYYSKSVYAASQGNTEQAMSFINKAIAKQPLPQYLALKATFLYQQNQFEKSKKLFKQCLAHEDVDPSLAADITNNYACVLNQIGERKQAVALWKDLTTNAYYTTQEVAWFNLGLRAWNDYDVLIKQKKIKRATAAAHVALKRFDQALNLEPSYVDALFFKAHVQTVLHKTEAVKKTLKDLLVLSPEHQGAITLAQQYKIS